jgi:hypothetical protein
LKIPRTPDRRITPLFGSGKFGRWPAHALVIVAHIPVPLPILRGLSAGHSPGTTRAAIINAHYSRMSGIYAARSTEDDAPRRQPRPAAAASPPCRPRAASRRPGPSRRRTLRFSGASWASASDFSKGFFNHSESNYWTPKPGPMLPPARLRGLEMIRASIYIASITALAAVLAIIATGITMQWQREHRATQLVKLANNIASCRNCPGDLELARPFQVSKDSPSFIGLTGALGQ